MFQDYVEFETPYGPAYVVYRGPERWDHHRIPKVSQVVVQCPDHIVRDKGAGKWYPAPEVVDYVLPRARAVCELLGVPAYEWLQDVRRGDIWAIERDFEMNTPISMMMDYYHDPQYTGQKRRRSQW